MKLATSLSFAALLALSQLAHAAPIVLNQNAIVNPSAELGAGSLSGNDIYSLPGWVTTGNFTAVQFGASAAPVASPGPEFGANFFAGGPNTPTDQATQIIDVSNLGTTIDAGQITFLLSGYFGGYLFQNDNATLSAAFFDALNSSLGTSALIGGFNTTSRANITQLLFDASTGVVPVGTRSILITLQMNRTEGFYNDGYADNLSFIAQAPAIPAPEPAAVGMTALGLGMCVALRKVRRRKVLLALVAPTQVPSL